MFDFYTENGQKFSAPERQAVELILGKSTQCVSRGVVELENGEVRIFTLRRPHHADTNGNTRLIGDPLHQSFGEAVAGLTRMEHEHITEITG